MEVPGKRQDLEQEKGSQRNAEEFCHPCGCDGEHIPAEGFCKTCGDYLCAECFKAHTIPRPLRNNVLLDKANMPRSLPRTRKPKSSCTIICQDHHDKIIEFYCYEHNAVVCGVCAVIKHKQCNTVYIPDIAEEYKDSKEFGHLTDTLNHLDSDIETLSNYFKDTISSVRNITAKAIQEIRKFREELNNYLDKKEQELVLATRRMEQEDTKLLQDLTDELDSLKNKNSGFMKQLKSVTTEISDLFITSKQLMQEVQSILDRFFKCAEKSKDICYTYEKEHSLTNLLISNTGFGKIKKTCHTKNVSYGFKNIMQKERTNKDLTSKTVERMSNVWIKTSEDTLLAVITGMVLLSSHRLLLADNSNRSVRTIDTASNTILSRLSMSDRPWDIALLPQDQAAVTLPNDKKIQIISTKDRLSAVRSVNVDGYCCGISATKDKLIVSFANPSKLDVMNFQGNVLVSLRTDSNGQTLFDTPWCNMIVEENGVPVIYVSDYNKNSITKLSIGGQILSTYTQKNWNRLNGMTATGDGQLLICNTVNNTVDVISEGGKVIQTLLDSKHGIRFPESICYCAEQNMLYVSGGFNDTVRAYRFT